MVRTRNQPASPQKDVAETKPRSGRNGTKSAGPTRKSTTQIKSPATSSTDKKTSSRKKSANVQTPEEAEPEDIVPISRRGLRSHGKPNVVTPTPPSKAAPKRKQQPLRSSEKKAESVTSSVENHERTELPKEAEKAVVKAIPVIVIQSVKPETERLSDSSDDEDSAPGPRSPVKMPTGKALAVSLQKNDEDDNASGPESPLKIPAVRVQTASPKKNGIKKERSDVPKGDSEVSPVKLNVSLRDRKLTTSKKPLQAKQADSGSEEFDVDDNADFDFSDKDSDFDIDKELETRPKKKRNIDAESESEEDDFEEVADKHVESDDDDLLLDRSPFASASKGPLEITVDLPGGGSKTREMDKDKWIAAQLRRRDKDIKTDIHKVHLLCGISHGFYLNEKIGRNQELLALAMSLWNQSRLNKEKDYAKLDAGKLHDLVASIKEQFSFAHHLSVGMCSVNAFRSTFLTKQCPSYLHMTMVVLLMLRALGMEVRLVYSMQPVAVKETKATKAASATKRKTPAKSKKTVKEEELSGSEAEGKPKTKVRAKRTAGKRKRAQSESGEKEVDEKNAVKRPARKAAKNAAGKRTAIKVEEDESNADVEMSEAELSEYEGEKKGRKKKTPAKKTSAKKETKGKPEEATGNFLEVPKAASVKGSPSTSFVSASSAVSRKSVAKEKGVDYWLEVYCGKTRAYVSVHCISGEVEADADIERSATQPLHYVVAFGEKSSLKDVTPKYATEWLTVNRKLQVDVEWWKDQMDMYRPLDKKKDEAEDEAIHEILLQRPRPDIPQLYKGHPLYILRPHLAKYEALYPPNPIPVDEVKGEPVYLRECAKLLHTRENWLREAKTVKKGERPYKEVKKVQRKKKMGRRGRNDPNAVLMAQITEKEAQKVEMVGLFGEWQIEDFVPPVAENGKVPRNSYGNVELYQPQMLPIGCSYINIKGNGLNRVAKKLDIDVAAAVTGWEFQGWRAHPVIEGWVVCKEYEKELMKAWKKEEVEIAKRAKERKSKKAMDNWRKIFKGLALKRRLQMKYGIDFTASEKLKTFIQKTDMTKVESDEE